MPGQRDQYARKEPRTLAPPPGGPGRVDPGMVGREPSPLLASDHSQASLQGLPFRVSQSCPVTRRKVKGEAPSDVTPSPLSLHPAFSAEPPISIWSTDWLNSPFFLPVLLCVALKKDER